MPEDFVPLTPGSQYRSLADVPARTPESDALSRDLRRRGFAIVGSIVCYAFMQSVGMVNDHVRGCFRAAAA
jgi:DNA-3-methyladenine glycosylase I